MVALTIEAAKRKEQPTFIFLSERHASCLFNHCNPRNIEPPAFIITEMEMEPVQLVPSEVIEHPQQLLDGKNLPRHVEEHPAPSEARRIDDLPALRKDELLRSFSGSPQDLTKRDESVEETVLSGREKRHRVRREIDPIRFFAHIGSFSRADDGARMTKERWPGRE